MKLNKQFLSATGLALTFGMFMIPVVGNAKGRGQGTSGGQQQDISALAANLPMQDLSELEKSGLIKMREEEKLARDVYQMLYDKWGHQTFSNIARGEQQHMDAMKALLEKYSLKDPIADSSVGVFTDPELEKLYTSLVAQGEKSQVEAFRVGATIEDLDIKDLYDFIEQTDNTDIRIVYQNLAKGSRNHLRSFTNQLSRNGIIYEAQFLTTAQINDIVSSPQEGGRVDENGTQQVGNRRSGKGQGRHGGAQGVYN